MRAVPKSRGEPSSAPRGRGWRRRRRLPDLLCLREWGSWRISLWDAGSSRPQPAIHRSHLTTLDVSPAPMDIGISVPSSFKKEDIKATHLNPQSSHSSTGFQPSLLVQISHFAAMALEKKNPNGHICPSLPGLLGSSLSPFVGLPTRIGLATRSGLAGVPFLSVFTGEPMRGPAGPACLLTPGLISVNRWMSVEGEAPMPPRMVDESNEPPSVAAATDTEEAAVW